MSTQEDHIVADVDELEEEGRIVTEIRGREIGIFEVDGELKAYTSWCAHQSGPICEGELAGTMEATFDKDTGETERQWVKDGKIIRCPWHFWEYDISSGECLSKNGIRLPEHEVYVEDGAVVVRV
jgi:nitrite reductase/ring-hydroxylating ferredoxin subunit